MKIIDNRGNRVKYVSVSIGEVFRLDNRYYIKTNIPEELASVDRACVSIDLSTGNKLEIGNLVTVEVVEAELVVKN